MGTTALTPLPYPESTDQPFVHLDLKALADATTESLFVAMSTAPPHKAGRRWYKTDDNTSWISDGTAWHRIATARIAVVEGSLTMTGTTGSFAITLPAGRFTVAPHIFVAPASASLGVLMNAVASSATAATAGYFQGANGVALPWKAFAIQMLPAAAAG